MSQGHNCTIRALLDQGSQSSFITKAMVQQLHLKRIPSKSHISGVGEDRTVISKSVVNIQIASRVNPEVVINVRAHVLKSITKLLPAHKVAPLEWKDLEELILADPEYHTPNRVDMLLGAEVYAQIIQEGIKRGPKGSAVAQCTSLGWILSGAMETINLSSGLKVMHDGLEDNNMLKRFWELEDEFPLAKEKLLTEGEKRCEEIFHTTTE